MRASVSFPVSPSTTRTETVPIGLDHRRDVNLISFCSPPQLFISFSCGKPCSFEMYAIHSPSGGDQRGRKLSCSPKVILYGSPPAAGITNRLLNWPPRCEL